MQDADDDLIVGGGEPEEENWSMADLSPDDLASLEARPGRGKYWRIYQRIARGESFKIQCPDPEDLNRIYCAILTWSRPRKEIRIKVIKEEKAVTIVNIRTAPPAAGHPAVARRPENDARVREEVQVTPPKGAGEAQKAWEERNRPKDVIVSEPPFEQRLPAMREPKRIPEES